MKENATTWKHLAPNPKSACRQLFIVGRRIRARDLYGMYANAEQPMTPEAIAADYGLPVEAVPGAIAYCQSDPPEIKEDFEREERIMEATGMNDPNYKTGGSYKLLSAQERARLGLCGFTWMKICLRRSWPLCFETPATMSSPL
jgi:uncharacterized protein (DUF433 family)